MTTDATNSPRNGQNIVVVRPGDQAPDSFAASVLLCGASDDVDTVLDQVASLWSGDGLLALFTTGTDKTDARSHWGARVDVVMIWDPGTEERAAATDEFGRWASSGRVVLGIPDASTAHPCRQQAEDLHVPVADTLVDTVKLAIDHIGLGAHRAGAHRNVPLILWRTSSFQTWLTAQEAAGNELLDGRMLWNYRVGPQQNLMFFWAFESHMWVRAERRENIAEVVLCRPDISSVVAYHPAATLADTEVVIVREYRAPSLSHDGFVRELPGGSAYSPSSTTIDNSPVFDQGITEMREETSIDLSPERFRLHQRRQLTATVSTQQQHVLSVELTTDEIDQARSDTRTHGVAADSERTYVEVHRFADLARQNLVDWTTLGAITAVLLDRFACSV
jgi:hypothetical protein